MIDLLPIFPCNIDKEPLSAHGFKSARRGVKWKSWPLVGFRTGEASGIDILDVDPIGRKWFGANFDALPQTRAHQTQRGLHLLFKHAPGLRCSTNKIAEGIDIRADGGYAIYWPATGLPIEDWPICEWPGWLLKEAMGTGIDNRNPSKSIVIPTYHDPVLAADCTAALRSMNAEDWSGKHDEWFELLMGAKAVGITLADFTEWCVSDPRYADDADIIGLKWHSVEPKHGGAFWRELSRRKIKIGKGYNLFAEVPVKPRSSPETKSRTRTFNADIRINRTISAIDRDPTERCLFWASCLCAEIVHECKLKPTRIMNLIAGNAGLTPLRETLGREGIRRTIGNAFTRIEEKLLKEPTGQKGD
jgi:Bifunctional DNA primase/polymerase, N-terminal/Primase C terminal 2 (PriCT-2)